jgi:hypothetical protein
MVFLCHACEDKVIARRLAEDLVRVGIDVFFDEWEITAGDSLRQKIDRGLEGCTHFIALLTPNSLSKNWVQTEMDAGFVRKVEGRSRFIPMRYHLGVEALPPLLRALHSPSLDDYDADLKKLVGDIYEVNRKPPLGSPPSFVLSEIEEGRGLSTAAAKVAVELIRRSENGRYGDPQLRMEKLLEATELLEEDLDEGVEELETDGWVKTLGNFAVIPTSSLFAELDSEVMEWNPSEDALRIAADLVNDERQMYVPKWAEKVGWPARRVNPALIYLFDRALAEHSNEVSQPFISNHIWKNASTRRFVRGGT